MSLILRFLPSFAPGITALFNPWVLVAFLAYSIALGGYSFFQGKAAGENALHEYIGKQAAETVRFVEKVVQLAGKVRTVYLKREKEIVTVTQYLEKEAEHVPSRAACNVTAGWMRVHNAAAEGQDRRITGTVDDATDTGVAERDALAQTIVPNYKAFHQVANDLRGCRAFVEGLGRLTAD